MKGHLHSPSSKSSLSSPRGGGRKYNNNNDTIMGLNNNTKKSSSTFLTPFRLGRRKKVDLGTTIHPLAQGKRIWDAFLAVAVIYNAIFCPFHLAFNVKMSSFHELMYRVVDVVFIVDIFVNFNTGFYDTGNNLVMDRQRISDRYITSWFSIDVISSIPLDLVFRESSLTDSVSALRLTKLLRMFKLMKMASVLRVHRIHRAFYNRWDGMPQIRYALLDIVGYVLLTFVYAHWFACVFFFVVKIDGVEDHAWFEVAKQKGIWDGELMSDPYTEYSLSLYHAVMVMFTIDMNFKPESNLERWTTLFFACTGAVVVLFSLTSATNIYHDTFGRQTRLYKSRIDHVNEFIKRKKLPDQLSNDLIDFYEHLRNRDHFSKLTADNAILEEVPKSLKGEILLKINPSVTNGELLKGCSNSLKVAILKQLEMKHLAPGEVFIRYNETARNLYFISEGEVECWEGDELGLEKRGEAVILTRGDYIGEASLSGLGRRTIGGQSKISATALCFCEVLVLSRERAKKLLENLPSVVRREFEDLVRKISGGGIGDENGVLNGVGGGGGGGQGSITAQEYERVIEELMLERMKREELEQRLYDQRNPHREAYNQDNDDVEDDGLNYPL